MVRRFFEVNLSFLPAIAFCSLLQSCGTAKPWFGESVLNPLESGKPESQPEYSVFLTGDGGGSAGDFSNSILPVLGNQFVNAGPKSAVVFLGDNIYPKGMPDSSGKNLKEAGIRLLGQTEFIKSGQGKKIFIPGNHDWEVSGKEGWNAVRRQEEFLEAQDGDMVFLPSYGCPGPEAVELSEDLVLIVVDSQWWLHEYEKPQAKNCNCRSCDDSTFVQNLFFLVEQYSDKRIILASHHPVYSRGNHGGKFRWTDHIFPLRIFGKALWFPLPVLGSLYPLSRQMGVSRQDFSNRRNNEFREILIQCGKRAGNMIFAAGHEHALQYFQVRDDHFIVSGGASKSDYARRGGNAQFSNSKMGFFRVDMMPEGSAWLEAWTLPRDKATGSESGDGDSGPAGTIIFRKKLE